MKKEYIKRGAAWILAAGMVLPLTACGRSVASLNTGEEMQVVDPATLKFPLAEKKTLTGLISYPPQHGVQPQ